MLLGEHDPVITLGKSTEPGDVQCDPRAGGRTIPVRSIGRGGRATLHNPGQLVGYFVCNVQELDINGDPSLLVNAIERAIIQTLEEFGIQGEQRAGARGVWAGGKKLGFIGLEWDDQQLMHGFAVNLNNDMDDFAYILPCGFDPAEITSVRKVSGAPVEFWDFAKQLEQNLGAGLNVLLNSATYSDLLLQLNMRPPWLTVSQFETQESIASKEILDNLGINTVCESAVCPNRGECYSHQTATFLLLGNCCSRHCAFCAVPTGSPGPLDPGEISRVVQAVDALNLHYVVLTSVTRDDLPGGGASVFAAVIAEIREQRPSVTVEVLIPDFQGLEEPLRIVLEAKPNVLNHNTETVPRLYRAVRSGARYRRTLDLLANAKQWDAAMVTKSGVMVGIGEETGELIEVFRDLGERGVDILTIGQYLRPSKDHLPMTRYYTPAEFVSLKEEALKFGFKHVESGPLVRSSYHAHEQADVAAG